MLLSAAVVGPPWPGTAGQAQTDERSWVESVSGDGRYVAFRSMAPDLVPGPTQPGQPDAVYVRDLRLNRTWQIQPPADTRAVGPSFSAAGRYLAYSVQPRDYLTATPSYGIVADLRRGTRRRIDLGFRAGARALSAQVAQISADGTHLLLYALPAPFRDGDRYTLYVRDLTDGTTEPVTVGPAGAAPNGTSVSAGLSADGSYAAVISYATNLVPGDTDGVPDVFVRDLRRGTTQLVGVSTLAGQRNGGVLPAWLSGDGRYIAVRTDARVLPADTDGGNSLYVHDLRRGTIELIGPTLTDEYRSYSTDRAMISADGRYVTFSSDQLASPSGRPQVYVRDRVAGTTTLASARPDGRPGTQGSSGASISANGRYVVFDSDASDLVSGDPNDSTDVFIRDLRLGTTRRVSVGTCDLAPAVTTGRR